MADASTQYKLIVLYMLDQVDFPLTNTQISNFMLDKDYTTYFTVQKAISELIDAGLMRTESTYNNTHYYITPAGRETLSYFPDKISDAIKCSQLLCRKSNGIAAGSLHGCRLL